MKVKVCKKATDRYFFVTWCCIRLILKALVSASYAPWASGSNYQACPLPEFSLRVARKRYNSSWPWKHATWDEFHDSVILSKLSLWNWCSTHLPDQSDLAQFDNRSSILMLLPARWFRSVRIWIWYRLNRVLMTAALLKGRHKLCYDGGFICVIFIWLKLTFIVLKLLYWTILANRILTSEQMWALFWNNRTWTGCFLLLFQVKRVIILGGGIFLRVYKTPPVGVLYLTGWKSPLRYSGFWFWHMSKTDLMWKTKLNKTTCALQMCRSFSLQSSFQVLYKGLKNSPKELI